MHTEKTGFKIGEGQEFLNVVFNIETAKSYIATLQQGIRHYLLPKSEGGLGKKEIYFSVMGSSFNLDDYPNKLFYSSVYPHVYSDTQKATTPQPNMFLHGSIQ